LTREEGQGNANAPNAANNPAEVPAVNEASDANEQDAPEMNAEDDELLQALQMSLQEGHVPDEEVPNANDENAVSPESATNILDDDAYMNELLSGLPGVDASELNLKELLGEEKGKAEDGDSNMKENENDKDKSKDKEKDKEKDKDQDDNDET